jgi:hypothetical protein
VDHLHLAGAGLGHDRCVAGLHGLGGRLGVDRVGLATLAPGSSVGPVDLHHDLVVGG